MPAGHRMDGSAHLAILWHENTRFYEKNGRRMKEPASFFILWQKNESGEPKKLFWPPKKFSMNNRLQVSLIVHLFVKDTIYPDGSIVVLLIENNVMPNLKTE